MTDADYVKNVAKRMNLSQAETKRLMKQSFATLVSVLDSGKKFTMPSLGTFGTKVREQHKAYNPFYEKFMLFPKKRVITYYPNSAIKEEVNKGEN